MSRYMQTTSGGRAWLPDNQGDGNFDALTGNDLAHMLANVNRFGGALRVPLSVAQHSLNVSRFVREEGGDRIAQLFALLHDAHEPFLGDIPSPMKASLPAAASTALAAYSRRLDRLIFPLFNLPPVMPFEVEPLVHDADLRALAWEARDLFKRGPVDGWTDNLPQAPPEILVAMEWRGAKRAFLARLRALGGIDV